MTTPNKKTASTERAPSRADDTTGREHDSEFISTLQKLPDALRYTIDTAALPQACRAILEQMPTDLRLDVILGESTPALPRSVRQLIKIGLGKTPLDASTILLGSLERTPGHNLQATLSFADQCLQIGNEDALPLEALLFEVMEQVLSREARAQVIAGLAFRSAVLTTLREITGHMLRAQDVAEALYIMLSGITSGHALGFNRAVLFLPQPDGTFSGDKAIGPVDHTEAHRIWEAIEVEAKGVHDLIDDYAAQNVETGLEQWVRSISLSAGFEDGDEVAQTLARHGAHRFAPPIVNPALAGLDLDSDFALARVEAHGHLLGILFADNAFTRAPITPEVLLYLGFFVDQTALIWENLTTLRRVEQQAHVDSLTGVLTRRAFEARFSVAANVSRQKGRACSLIILDLDHFKRLNDTQGHDAGDLYLCKVVSLLADCTRDDDVIGRFGGDEFLVLLPGADHDALVQAIERIGRAGVEQGVAMSVGGACFPDDGTSYSELFSAADACLYRAKRAGRGRGCTPHQPHIAF